MFGLSGWVTKLGIIIFAIGGALLASADLFPYEVGIAWLKFFGTLCTSLGVAVSGVGIARKVDKGNVAMSDQVNNMGNNIVAAVEAAPKVIITDEMGRIKS